MRMTGLALVGLLVLTTRAAIAVPPQSAKPVELTAADAALAFGSREYVQNISLSPDGKRIAFITPAIGRGLALMVADLEQGGQPKAIMKSAGDPDQLASCDWSTSARLICRISFILKDGTDRVSFTRLVAINADGTGLQTLTARASDRALGIMQSGGELLDWGDPQAEGAALMTRTFVPEYSTGTRVAEERRGLGVELVDTVTLKRKLVESPREFADDYISDGRGVVRLVGYRQKLASGYDASKISYQYRKAGSRDWQSFGQVELGAATVGFIPSRVDPDLNVVYGFDTKDGRRALYKVALDGSMTRTLVFARPDVDVSNLVTIGRQQRVVGVSYVTDRRQVEFFDPVLARLGKSLAKALPGQPLVSFIDASADESKILLYAGSDNDAGRYYVYDKATRGLAETMPARPRLDGVRLATVKPINYPAADGTLIPGYLTLPPGSDGRGIPAIVLPHGGPGARDEWGFDWLSQYFAARGYAVLQPNFRGSTGYGDAWFQKNGFQSWRTAIGDVNDGGKWLVAQGIAVPDKLAIVGWSYGGYAALQSPALDPALFKAIVAIAPVTDLDALREEARMFTKFRMVDAFIGTGPHIREGSPTRNAAKIKAPVLLFHGDLDSNVGIAESRLMADRLKDVGGKVELVEFKGLDHQLNDTAARTAMLAKIDAFLRNTTGMTADK